MDIVAYNYDHIFAVSGDSESAARRNLVTVERGGGRPLHPPTPKRRYRQPIKAGPIHPNLAVLYADYVQIGWSLSRYAADRLGITRQTVALWFSGRRYPRQELLERIRSRTGIVIPPLTEPWP